MDAIVRGLFVYLFVFLVFRVAGKRSLAETTPFDLVLLLIISETVQQAMVDNDHSITRGVLLVATLVGTDILISFLKMKSKSFASLFEDMPIVVMKDGKGLRQRMVRERVSEEDILTAARQTQGLKSLDEVKYAVVEPDGTISVVPKNGN